MFRPAKAPRRAAATGLAVATVVESLESRQMLAADPTLGAAWIKKGTLYYEGTAAADDIYITNSSGKIRVLNHYKEVAAFEPGSFARMSINLGNGNDNLYIGGLFDGPTTINGGTGDDHLYCSDGDDTIDAGPGDNSVTGLNGNDRITAGDGDDAIQGNKGNDTIFSGGGRDGVWGGEDNDVIDAGLDADTIRGGDGTDTVSYADRTNPVFVDAEGYGRGEPPDDGEAGEHDFVDADNENLIGGQGNDVLTGNYDPNGNFGTTFIATNILRGGAGNDTLNGLAGNDVLDGGTGADVFNGGAGIDTADYSYRTDNIVIRLDGKANDGTSGRRGRSAEADNVQLDVENVVTGSGHDTVVASDVANVIYTNAGNDLVYGNGGNDVIFAGAGADKIYGGLGDDVLYGRDLGKLPKNAKARRAALAAAADLLDGEAGFDRVQPDVADKLLNYEKTLK